MRDGDLAHLVNNLIIALPFSRPAWQMNGLNTWLQPRAYNSVVIFMLLIDKFYNRIRE